MRLGRRLLGVTLAILLATEGNALAFTVVSRGTTQVVKASKTAPAPAKKAPSAKAALAFDRFESAFSRAQGVKWSGDSDSPRSVWGFQSGRMAGTAEGVARAFISRHASLFGTSGSDLVTTKVLERLGVKHVRLEQFVNGLPVEGACVAVHMDGEGRVFAVDSTYRTGLTVDMRRNVTGTQAAAKAKARLGVGATSPEVSMAVMPTGRGKAVLVYKIQTTERTRRGRWTHLVAAPTGTVLSSYNDVRYEKALRGQAVGAVLPQKLKSQLIEVPRATVGAAPSSTRATRGTWQTLTSQGFEGTWPAPYWSVLCTPQYSSDPVAFWGKATYAKYAGNYSLWPARLGPNGRDPSRYYPDNLDSWAVYGPFSLANAAQARLTLQLWCQSERNFDWFYWLATDGRALGGYVYSGDTGGWATAPLNLTSEDDLGHLGHLRAESKAYIAIRFRSDNSIVDDGPFVDNVVVQKYVEGGSAGTTSGTYQGYVYPTTGDAPRELRPMASQYVLVGPNRATTNASGAYSTAIRGPVHAWLKGPYAQALNEDYYCVESNAVSGTWDYKDSRADEVNLFYHVNRIHDYFRGRFGFGGTDYTMRAWAHVGTDYPNAFYDPGTGYVYFGDGDGSTLRNMARSDDVVYHEYAHGVCDHILDLPYVLESGAMSEGYADYFASSFTNDPIMGQWVFVDPKDQRDLEQDGVGHKPGHNMRYDDQGIRNTYLDPAPANDWWALGAGVQPSHELDDTYNDGGWVHHNSQIVAGGLWDMRNALGQTKADRIIFESLFFWPYDLESSVRAMKMADDLVYGNSKWTDGSPHSTQIDDAVALHDFPTAPVQSVASATRVYTRSRTRCYRNTPFYGYVYPGVMGSNPYGQNAYGTYVKLTVQRYYRRRWRTVSRLATRLRYYDQYKSRYSVTYKPRARGQWRVITYFPGSLAYFANDGAGYWHSVRPSSRVVRFRVY